MVSSKLPCIICGSANTLPARFAVGDRLHCLACFHGWRLEKPVFHYDKIVTCSFGSSLPRLKSQIAFFQKFVPPGARILEIGCATGELAAATRSRLDIGSYEAIELSPAASQAALVVDRIHVRGLQELVADGQIDGQFDLILISHVLEHIEDPATELRAMRSVLHPMGKIFIEVPNGSGNRHLPFDDNRTHLHFFSATSLTLLLAKRGFDVVASETDAVLDVRYSDSLRVVAQQFQLPKSNPTLLSDHPKLSGEDKLVVWGAGTLVDELLANYFDVDKIDFFIDRDPAKLNATCLGKPVRDPAALGQSPRTVLINSIDFASSIAADIEKLYPMSTHRLVPIGDLLNG